LKVIPAIDCVLVSNCVDPLSWHLAEFLKSNDYVALQWQRYARARWLEDPPPWLRPAYALLCFGNSVNRKSKFYHIWPLTALFVLFWQWNNLSGVSDFCVLRATTKTVVNFFQEKSAPGWPGSRMFWPWNDLAPLAGQQ